MPSILASLSISSRFKFVQISTDHYYMDSTPVLHKETDAIILTNEYAISKYIGECFSQINKNSLVIRTNIVGVRSNLLKPTFVEWAIDSIYNDVPMNLYYDMFTSPIHVDHFSEFLDYLIVKDGCGVYNLSGREVVSKEQFIVKLFNKMHPSKGSLKAASSSVLSSDITRANSLGLNVTKAETKIGKCLPNIDDCIGKIILDMDEKKG